MTDHKGLLAFLETADMASREQLIKLCKTTASALSDAIARAEKAETKSALLEVEIHRIREAIKMKGGTEHSPTEDAYNAACAAIKKHKARAEKAEAALVRAKVGLVQARDELDEYSRHEYPFDHPVHERYRQMDYDANPARIALSEISSEAKS